MERKKRKQNPPLRYRLSVGEGDKRSKLLKPTRRVGGAGKKLANTTAARFSQLEQTYSQDSDERARLRTQGSGSPLNDDNQLIVTDDDRVDELMDDHDRGDNDDIQLVSDSDSDNDEQRLEEQDSQVAITSNNRSILNAAKKSLVQSEGRKSLAKAINDNSRRLEELESKQNSIKESVDKILQLLNQQASTSAASATSIPPEDIINGIDVIHMPCRDAYQFGLDLLDMLFTPEEMARSLVYKSRKSTKDALDKDKVYRMMYLIKKRYQKDPPNMKMVVKKMNQKCLDKVKGLNKRRNIQPIDEGGDTRSTPSPNPNHEMNE